MKLPAENEDRLKRPAYIHDNDAGVAICEKRYEFGLARALERGGYFARNNFVAARQLTELIPGTHQVAVSRCEGCDYEKRVRPFLGHYSPKACRMV